MCVWYFVQIEYHRLWLQYPSNVKMKQASDPYPQSVLEFYFSSILENLSLGLYILNYVSR